MKNLNYKVSIAVPFQQHSFRAAKGFINEGTLLKYYTSVYNNDKGIYRVLKHAISNDLVQRMKGRQDIQITPFVKTFNKFWGLLYIASFKISFLRRYSPNIRNHLFKKFGKNVAKDIIRCKTDIVLSYDTQAYDIFLNLKKQKSQIVTVLDMASTTAQKIREIVDEELKINNPFSQSLIRHDKQYTLEKCKEYLEEMKMADYFLVPSIFVGNCVEELGFPKEKILYLSHGVDISQFRMKKVELKNEIEKLKFLFVGRVETAKGIYYALEAFRQLQNLNIELIVVGDMMGMNDDLAAYTQNAKFLGLKRRDEMPKYYQEADVFLLTSLWEGSSLSMLEAMASGLPVIASKYSCAPEVVSKEEGFVIEPRNIDEIKNCIMWYVNNRESIPKMSLSAREKAEMLSWDTYAQNIANTFESLELK